VNAEQLNKTPVYTSSHWGMQYFLHTELKHIFVAN